MRLGKVSMRLGEVGGGYKSWENFEEITGYDVYSFFRQRQVE